MPFKYCGPLFQFTIPSPFKNEPWAHWQEKTIRACNDALKEYCDAVIREVSGGLPIVIPHDETPE